MGPDSTVIHFTTTDGAYPLGEQWSMPVTGRIGRDVAVIPATGHFDLVPRQVAARGDEASLTEPPPSRHPG